MEYFVTLVVDFWEVVDIVEVLEVVVYIQSHIWPPELSSPGVLPRKVLISPFVLTDVVLCFAISPWMLLSEALFGEVPFAMLVPVVLSPESEVV